MTRSNYKRVPTSLKSAYESDKHTGIRNRQLSVERLAELYAVSGSRLYKWMDEGDMPVNRLAAWFHNTGGRAVIRYLCAQAGGMFVPVPTGRQLASGDIHQLQTVLNDAVGLLLAFYAGKTEAAATLAALQQAMEGMAWHRGNVEKHAQPELELEI